MIVAIGVSNQASDAVHLLPMLERIEANTGQRPDSLTADAQGLLEVIPGASPLRPLSIPAASAAP